MYTMVDSSTIAFYIPMSKVVQGTTGEYAVATTEVVYAYNTWY